MTIANSEAAQIWDGPMGEHWAQEWDHYDRSLAAYHHRLLAAADLRPGAHALDIGCGNGRLTRDVATAIGTGTVTGLDLSTAMVQKATELARHQGVTNARFVHADIQSHEFLPKTSIWPSAGSGRCSSPIRSRRSPTSATGASPAPG
jgi:trans-aconitate methyltransferase